MLVVDAHSKWLEIFPINAATTEKTLQLLRNIFASYGLPDQIVTDNGSQFTSSEFQRFTKANGINNLPQRLFRTPLNHQLLLTMNVVTQKESVVLLRD